MLKLITNLENHCVWMQSMSALQLEAVFRSMLKSSLQESQYIHQTNSVSVSLDGSIKHCDIT